MCVCVCVCVLNMSFGLVWFGLALCYINHCRLLNAKSFLYIYIKYMISKHILLISSLNEPELILFLQ